MAEQRKFVPAARTIRIGTMDEDNQGKAGGGGVFLAFQAARSVVPPASDQSGHTRPWCCKTGCLFFFLFICFFDRTAQTAANEETGLQHQHHQQPHPRRVHAHPTCPRSHIPRSHEVTFTVDEVAPWNTDLHSRRSDGRDSVGTFTLTALWCSSPSAASQLSGTTGPHSPTGCRQGKNK